MSDIVPRSEVTKRGVKGVGAVAGGVGLLVLAGIAVAGPFHLLGLIAGGVIAVVGMALSRSKSDRTAGVVATVAGFLTVGVALIPSLRFLMVIPGIGLLGAGIYSLVRFFRGMKSRT
jgi:hypothetical protein